MNVRKQAANNRQMQTTDLFSMHSPKWLCSEILSQLQWSSKNPTANTSTGHPKTQLQTRPLVIQNQPQTRPLVIQNHPQTRPLVMQNQLQTRPLTIQDQLQTRPLSFQNQLQTRPLVIQNHLQTRPLVIQNQLQTRPLVIQNQLQTRPLVIQNQLQTRPLQALGISYDFPSTAWNKFWNSSGDQPRNSPGNSPGQPPTKKKFREIWNREFRIFVYRHVCFRHLCRNVPKFHRPSENWFWTGSDFCSLNHLEFFFEISVGTNLGTPLGTPHPKKFFAKIETGSWEFLSRVTSRGKVVWKCAEIPQALREPVHEPVHILVPSATWKILFEIFFVHLSVVDK